MRVALRLVMVALALMCAVTACPKLPPVSGCRPLAQSCNGDRPRVCSQSQRWHVIGDVPCREVAGACVVSDAGVARCVSVADAGSDGAP